MDKLPGLRDAADRVDARYAAAGPNERRVELGLGPVLDRFRSARSQAETLLAVAAIGLLACALANLGLLGVLSFDRRSAETTLSRVRGASSSQTLGGRFAEAALIAVPAGLAGWALAVLAIDGRGSSLSGWLAAAVVVGTVVLLVASIEGVARRPLGSLRARGRRPRAAGASQAGSRGPGRDRRAPGRLERPAPRPRELGLRRPGAPGAVPRRDPGPARAGLRDRGVAPPSLSAAGGGPARPADEGSRAPARPQPRRAATGHDLAPGARARRRARDRGVLGSDGEHDPGRAGRHGRARDGCQDEDRRPRRLEPPGEPRRTPRRGRKGRPGLRPGRGLEHGFGGAPPGARRVRLRGSRQRGPRRPSLCEPRSPRRRRSRPSSRRSCRPTGRREGTSSCRCRIRRSASSPSGTAEPPRCPAHHAVRRRVPACPP